MNSATILIAVHDYLKPLIETAGGELDLSETPQDTLAQLAASPKRWRVILQWLREDTKGRTRSTSDFKLLAITQQAKGLDRRKGADVQTSRAGDPALLFRYDAVAKWILGLRLIHPQIDCQGFEMLSAYWLFDPDLATRQIAAEFSINYGLGPIELVAVEMPVDNSLYTGRLTEDGDRRVYEDGDQRILE